MKICFPVESDKGTDSTVYNHFGSAPLFMVFDTDTNNLSTITNNDQHHAHGACNPIMALDNQTIDSIVVGGIGRGALSKLNQAGIRVFQSGAANIKENIAMLLEKQLQEYSMHQCCGGHSNNGGCAH